MRQVSKFQISEFTNPSGDVVFRVDGYLDGKRVRKNFATRAEANAEKQVLDLSAAQADHGMHVAATRLTDEQLREAEAGFHRLEGRTRSLTFYLKSNPPTPSELISLRAFPEDFLGIFSDDLGASG